MKNIWAFSTARQTMIELPEDVWLVIVGYLQRSQLQHLRGVNRCLLNIAMDARYRHVELRDLNVIHSLWVLHRLQDPYVAHRVRHLIVRTSFLKCILPPHPQHTQPSRTSPEALPVRTPESAGARIRRVFSFSLMRRKSTQKPTCPEPQLMPFPELLATMSGLPNVVKYEVDSWLLPPQSTFPLYAAPWTRFGPNLLSLKLNIQLEALRVILTPVPEFPQLEEFCYTLSKAYLETDGSTILKEVLAPFINGHSQSLTFLNLMTYDNFDCTPLLSAMLHLPVLSKLVIRHPFLDMNRTDLSGLHHIFALHSSHLRELDLSIYFPMAEHSDSVTGQVFSTLPHWKVPFPELRRLSLTLESRHNRLPALFPYLRLVSRSLVDLTLGNHSFFPEDMTSLLRTISHQSSESNIGRTSLRSLSISIRFLRPSTLDAFASYLPELENLRLVFEKLTDDPVEVQTGFIATPAFLGQITHKLYPSWKLRHLTVLAAGYTSTPMTGAHFRAFAKAIPALEMINGIMVTESDRDMHS